MSQSATRFLQQENIRLKKEVETLTRQNLTLHHYLETIIDIYRANQNLATQDAPLEVLNQLLFNVIDVVGAKDGSISRLDEETGDLVFVLVHGQLGQRLEGYRIKSNLGIAGWVVENKEPIIVNNPRQDWRFSLQVDEAFQFFTRCIASVPVIEQGQLIGVIQLLNKPGDFTEADVALLLILSQVAARVLKGR